MKPFIKWVGGKANIAGEIAARMPEKIRTYVEPFLGGGAVFFALGSRCENAFLADTNEHLVSAFWAVRGYPEELGKQLAALEAKYNGAADQEDFYYRMRGEQPMSAMAKAVRLIFLNRAGFNGLWRENKKGEMNVPWGKKTQIALPGPVVLDQCSRALSKASIRRMGFAASADFARGPGDVLYMDPPYVGTFKAYQPEAVQLGVLEAVGRRAAARGAKVLISNSDAESVRDAFADSSVWKLDAVEARMSVGGDRKPRRELLIQSA